MDSIRAILASVWPFFGLAVRTPRLELKPMLEHELAQLAQEVVSEGVHDEQMMPFNSNWALKPSPECQRQFLCYHWSTRSAWGEGKRNLAFGVYLLESEQLIGSIDLFTADVRLREFGMGAWLLKPFQDQHFGQEAGQALLHLAFETIGVDRVHAGFWHDNHRSGRAQLAAGGVVTHDEWRIRHSADGQEHAERMCGVRITPETWVRPKFPIAVEGFEPCRNLLVADS